MSQNRLADGCTLSLTAPYDVASGAGALVDGVFGVADGDYDSGDAGEFHTEGVFELTKVGSQAWTVGMPVYWDNTNKRCTSDAAVGRKIGFCTEAVASGAGDTLGNVKLLGGYNSRTRAVDEGTPAPSSVATAGAGTITAAHILSGIYVRDCAGSGRTDTLSTAALLVAAVPGAKVGDVLKFYVINGSDAAETLTLAAGTGGDFDTNQTAASRVVPQNASKLVHIRLTNVTASSEAYVVYA